MARLLEVLAQCSACHYTETLPCSAGGRVILTSTFSLRRSDRTIRHRCGAEARFWTGRDHAYRLRGVIA